LTRLAIKTKVKSRNEIGEKRGHTQRHRDTINKNGGTVPRGGVGPMGSQKARKGKELDSDIGGDKRGGETETIVSKACGKLGVLMKKAGGVTIVGALRRLRAKRKPDRGPPEPRIRLSCVE